VSIAVYSAFSGLIYGLLLFMMASGLTIVFGMMGIVNFAHTSFYMFAAYFALLISTRVGFVPALIIAPLLVAAIGFFVEVFLLRKVHRHGHGPELLVTFGLLLISEELVKLLFGTGFADFSPPPALRFSAFTVFGLQFPFYRIFVAAVAVVLFVALYLIMNRTRLGIIVRGCVRRPDMASALGHNVSAVLAGVFTFGCWMAGVAGVLGGPILTTSPQMAIQQAIPVFVVVVVGGLGSLSGALYASLIIGILSSLVVAIDVSFLDASRWMGFGDKAALALGSLSNFKISGLAGSIPILLMLVVLLVRPSGLQGDRI